MLAVKRETQLLPSSQAPLFRCSLAPQLARYLTSRITSCHHPVLRPVPHHRLRPRCHQSDPRRRDHHRNSLQLGPGLGQKPLQLPQARPRHRQRRRQSLVQRGILVGLSLREELDNVTTFLVPLSL